MKKQRAALGRAALKVAEGEMKAGAKETGGNNLGPYVEKYLKPFGLKPPQPWCAAFVSWCIQEAAKELGIKPPLPYLVGARALLNHGRRLQLVTADPKEGDIVVWSRGNPAGPFGHAGLVLKRRGESLETIEGNRTPRVEKFKYTLRRMPRLLGFVRIG